MGFLEPVLWIRDNEGLKAEREGGREKACEKAPQNKGTGSDWESSRFYGHLVF